MVRRRRVGTASAYDGEMNEDDLRFWFSAAWIVMTGIGIAVFVRHIAAPRLRGREIPQCDACGYDLTGLLGRSRCPECGSRVRKEVGGSRASWRFESIVFACAPCVGAAVTLGQLLRSIFPYGARQVEPESVLFVLILTLLGAAACAICALPLVFIHRSPLEFRLACVATNIITPIVLLVLLWSPAALATDALASIASAIGTALVATLIFALLPIAALLSLFIRGFLPRGSRVRSQSE